jgi:low temperature requirement protein LtrA
MENRQKKASWLELFYDIAFVALVAQLTYLTYEHHHSLLDFVNIFLVAYTIFVAWWAATANRNLKPTETAADKLSVQVQMVGAFLMSITMPHVFAGQYFGFFFTLGLLRFVQASTVWGMYISHPETRPVTYNILQGFLVAAGLWVLSAFVPPYYNYILAFMALAIDILTPLTRGKGNSTRYLNVFHLRERLGLFIILVMGESMIVVALSNTAANLSMIEPSMVFSGLGMMIALWWLYFGYNNKHHPARPRNLFAFIHSHGLLFGSIILLSVGYKLAIEQVDSFIAGWFVVAGASGVLVALTLIRLMLSEKLFSIMLRTMVFLVPITAIVFATVLYGTVHTMIMLITLLFMALAIFDYKFSSVKSVAEQP